MPLDVFVYGYVRHIVCAQKSLNVCHLRDNLWNAMNVGKKKNKSSVNLKIKIINPHCDRSKATGEGGMF
jgi:hypothetical protein